MSKLVNKLCILAAFLLICAGVFFSARMMTSSEIISAYSVSDLNIRFTFSDLSVADSRLWFNEADGRYYAFIPGSLVTDGNASFSNVGSDVSLFLGDEKITAGDDLVEFAIENSEFDIRFTNSAGAIEEVPLSFVLLDKIPVCFLNTDSGSLDTISESKENSETGGFLFVNEYGNNEYSDTAESVRVRGNGSFINPKKSFTIGLSHDAIIEGLGKSDKWYLLSQCQDGSKIRSMLVWNYMESHSDVPYVDMEYTDVFVNGEYYGLYLIGRNKSAENLGLTDLEEINNSVNASGKEYDPIVSPDGCIHSYNLPVTPADLSGSFILEVCNADRDLVYPNAFPAFISNRGNCFLVKSPDNASFEEVSYIKGLVDEMEAAIYGEGGCDPVTGRHYSEFLDISSYADFWLIKEGFMDKDVLGNISIYMYKDADSDSLKLRMGPVWDVDTVFGVGLSERWSYLSDAEFLPNELLYADRLLEFEEVRDAIAAKLESDFIPWCTEEMKPEIENLYGRMDLSYSADSLRWPGDEWFPLLDTRSGNACLMVDFMNRRSSFLHSVFIDGDVWHKVTFMNDGQIVTSYMVPDGGSLKYLPKPLNFLGFLAGWKTDSDIRGEMADVTVHEDLVLEAVWIDAEWLLKGDRESIDRALDEIDIFDLNESELSDFTAVSERIAEGGY